jgi:hypothetical protein
MKSTTGPLTTIVAATSVNAQSASIATAITAPRSPSGELYSLIKSIRTLAEFDQPAFFVVDFNALQIYAMEQTAHADAVAHKAALITRLTTGRTQQLLLTAANTGSAYADSDFFSCPAWTAFEPQLFTLLRAEVSAETLTYPQLVTTKKGSSTTAVTRAKFTPEALAQLAARIKEDTLDPAGMSGVFSNSEIPFVSIDDIFGTVHIHMQTIASAATCSTALAALVPTTNVNAVAFKVTPPVVVAGSASTIDPSRRFQG